MLQPHKAIKLLRSKCDCRLSVTAQGKHSVVRAPISQTGISISGAAQAWRSVLCSRPIEKQSDPPPPSPPPLNTYTFWKHDIISTLIHATDFVPFMLASAFFSRSFFLFFCGVE